MRVCRERLSIFVCASFPFGFEGQTWDLIILVPEHCLFFFFECVTYFRWKGLKHNLKPNYSMAFSMTFFTSTGL